jgi:hypothetical protein
VGIGENAGVGPAVLIAILREITSSSTDVRGKGCDQVVDLVAEYSELEAVVLSQVLACLALTERDHACQEAELHALVELVGQNFIFHSVLTSLAQLDSRVMQGSSVEHYQYLMSLLSNADSP